MVGQPTRWQWTLGVASFIALASVAVAASEEKERDLRNDNENESDEGESDSERQEQRAAATEDAREHDGENAPRRPGRIQASSDVYEGRYVSFMFNASTCKVTHYAYLMVEFFGEIDVPGECDRDSVGNRGSNVRVATDAATLVFHDAPNGLIRFKVEAKDPVRLALAPGLASDATEGLSELRVQNLSARLVLTSGGPLAKDGATYLMRDTDANFIIHPAKPTAPEHEKVRTAISQGHVGAQVDVFEDAAEGPAEVLRFDDVSVRVAPKGPAHYRVLLDSNLTEGRLFVFNLPASMGADALVRYFDFDETNQQVEALLERAQGIEDVIEITAGEAAKYHVFQDDAGTHVLLAVPHFSLHAAEITGLPPAVVPVIVYGIVFGILFVLMGVVGLFLGRRRAPL